MDAVFTIIQVMWAMEYNPNIYSSYDDKRQPLLSELLYDDKPNDKHKYGKFERNNLKTGAPEQNSALAVFLVASVLETKHRRLMKEAKGLDDVVEVIIQSFYICVFHIIMFIDANKKKLSRSWVKYLGIWMQKKH